MTENGDVQKPVGPFDDFEACVRHFEDDPDVEDPDAMCGWMESNKDLAQEYDPEDGGILSFVESLKDPDAEKVLTNLSVTYVSGVENPAIDSQWVYAKDADTEHAGADWGVTSPIVLHTSKTVAVDGGGRAPVWSKADGEEDEQDEEEQKAWAPVLIPNETDKQGDVIPADEIESAAHDFLAEYRKIDTDHDLFEGKGVPIESWTLKESGTFTLPDGSESREYPAGTWMMGVQFSDEAWERVKEGELTGFSIYGEATQLDVEDFLSGDVSPEEAQEASGATAAALAAKGATGDTGETMTDENDNDNSGSPVDLSNLDEEALKGLSNSEVKDLIQMLQAQIESEDGEKDEEDDEDSDEDEEPEMNAGKDEDAGSGSGDGPSLQDIHDTVKETNETVKSVQDRVDDLEQEVFGKDGEDEPEATPQEDLDEQVEEKMADILGVEKSELPADEDERNEVIRKHIHENTAGQEDRTDPDSWSDDDFEGLM